MAFKTETHHLIAEAAGVDVTLTQLDFAGNEGRIIVSNDQLLSLADRLRGITRPSPEAEESRKLRVLSERLRDILIDEGFRKILIENQRYTDWLEKIDALDDLAWEYAYGLRPNQPEPEAEPTNKAPEQANKKAAQDGLPNV